ncbi:cysteine desulfurase [Allofustis seminis]|uniref:cysteine desulfurase n=1 Tax=Allofustis seminis TaxID=166939 RepID=UPI000370D32B|nr:cysteine desulfurase [Allofustis seminis]
MPLNINKVRNDFPILKEKINDHSLIYFDNAATTQKPSAVIERIVAYYQKENANVYRSVHALSARATHAYEASRQKVQAFIHAAHPEEIIFTSGATASLNQIMQGFVVDRLELGDEIIISALEHHSNLIPWQVAAQATGAVLRYIELTDTGEISLASLKEMVSSKTKIIAVSHVSNVLGTIQPLKEICKIAHKVGAVVIADGAQAVAHLPVNVVDLDVDFYAFSGHKVYGPTGIGILYGKRKWLEQMQPAVYGGEMIARVDDFSSTWAQLPQKLEAGTPNIAGAVGLGAAIDYLKDLPFDQALTAESDVYKYAYEQLQKVSDIELYGPKDVRKRTSVIAFNLSGIHPHDVATALDMQGIAIRAGHHCAQPLMRRLSQIATARMSLGIYNTREEVDDFIVGLNHVREFFSHGF